MLGRLVQEARERRALQPACGGKRPISHSSQIATLADLEQEDDRCEECDGLHTQMLPLTRCYLSEKGDCVQDDDGCTHAAAWHHQCVPNAKPSDILVCARHERDARFRLDGTSKKYVVVPVTGYEELDPGLSTPPASPDSAAKEKKDQAAPAAGPTGGGARKRGACSVCGQLGHNKSNKKKCPGPGPPPGGLPAKAKPTARTARTHESDSEYSFEEESDDEEAAPPVRAENQRPKRSGKDVSYAGLDEN